MMRNQLSRSVVHDHITSVTDPAFPRLGHHCDVTDLISRVHRSLKIACRTIRLLAESGFDDREDVRVMPEKVIAETALLLVVTAPASAIDSSLAVLHDRLARRLVPFARSQRMLAGICLTPRHSLDYTFAHICLTHLGYRDARFDRLFSQGVSAETAFCTEQPPHRQMEYEWLRQLWGRDDTMVRLHRSVIVKHSILGRPMDALSATRDDIYAFTHGLMFLTNFGSCSARLPRSRRALAADAEAALGWCLDEEDYDLGAEVLLTWPLLGLRWSPVATFGFTVLTGVEDVAGFLPAPTTRLSRYKALREGERSRYAVGSAYHTAYVMGLLCGVMLKVGSAPPANAPRSHRRSHGSADAILELLDGESQTPHWRHYMLSLNAHGQDALAPLLLGIGLRRAAAKRDLGKMQAYLRLGDRYDLLEGAASQQAIRLLARAASLESLS
jgi:hypothetical protein